jgi:phage terminase small subunit
VTMTSKTELNTRQQAFVRAYVLNGNNGAAAVREAGYSINNPESARRQAYQLLQNPLIKDAVAQGRHEFVVVTEYDAKAVMSELDAAIDFARSTKNANALVRAIEAKAKVAGLMTDKVELNVNNVDICAALQEARSRLLRPLPDGIETVDFLFD